VFFDRIMRWLTIGGIIPVVCIEGDVRDGRAGRKSLRGPQFRRRCEDVKQLMGNTHIWNILCVVPQFFFLFPLLKIRIPRHTRIAQYQLTDTEIVISYNMIHHFTHTHTHTQMYLYVYM
jgi:hypothetical protein